METKEVTKPIRDKLREPLPKEAISQHPTKKFLSTIKAIYVVERLNNVFGIGKWSIKYDIVEAGEKMIVAKGVLIVPEFGIEVEQYGGNDNADRGDAFKGACTDCLTKIGSYLEIGIDVFKGLSDNTQGDQKKPERKSNTDKRPWLSEKQLYSASERIKSANPYVTVEDGKDQLSLTPQEFLDKLKKEYQMKNIHKESLEEDVRFQQTMNPVP